MPKPKDVRTWYAKTKLNTLLQRQPINTNEEVQKFLTFAIRCLKETPVGSGRTAIATLENPVILNGVTAVERWLAGETSNAQLEDAQEAAFTESLKATNRHSVETAAACLCNAAVNFRYSKNSPAGFIPVLDEADDFRGDAASEAVQVSYQIRESLEEPFTYEATVFQLKVASEIWPAK